MPLGNDIHLGLLEQRAQNDAHQAPALLLVVSYEGQGEEEQPKSKNSWIREGSYTIKGVPDWYTIWAATVWLKSELQRHSKTRATAPKMEDQAQQATAESSELTGSKLWFHEVSQCWPEKKKNQTNLKAIDFQVIICMQEVLIYETTYPKKEG